jgi:hypothetical protein
VAHAAAGWPGGVDYRLRRNPFTIDSLPHGFWPSAVRRLSPAEVSLIGGKKMRCFLANIDLKDLHAQGEVVLVYPGG